VLIEWGVHVQGPLIIVTGFIPCSTRIDHLNSTKCSGVFCYKRVRLQDANGRAVGLKFSRFYFLWRIFAPRQTFLIFFQSNHRDPCGAWCVIVSRRRRHHPNGPHCTDCSHTAGNVIRSVTVLCFIPLPWQPPHQIQTMGWSRSGSLLRVGRPSHLA